MDLFIKDAFNPETRFFYGSVVLTLLFSIVVHELAHGWAAIRQGDDTPIRLGRMTGNPMVHMGPMSLALVFLAGIGWGMMPVDPTRFRSKYGDAIVSAAGPVMNLLLAIVSLTALALWQRFGGIAIDNDEAPQVVQNSQMFLFVFGYINIGLTLFNLAPVPPLDGSRILGSFSRGYRRWVEDSPQLQMLLFPAYFILIGGLNNTEYSLWLIAGKAASGFVRLLFLV